LDLEEMEESDLEKLRRDYERLAADARESLRGGGRDTDVCDVAQRQRDA
jgi:hypothetical protein